MFDAQLQWCSFCSSAPATGMLTVILDGEDSPVDLPCCTKCLNKIPDENWI